MIAAAGGQPIGTAPIAEISRVDTHGLQRVIVTCFWALIVIPLFLVHSRTHHDSKLKFVLICVLTGIQVHMSVFLYLAQKTNPGCKLRLYEERFVLVNGKKQQSFPLAEIQSIERLKVFGQPIGPYHLRTFANNQTIKWLPIIKGESEFVRRILAQRDALMR